MSDVKEYQAAVRAWANADKTRYTSAEIAEIEADLAEIAEELGIRRNPADGWHGISQLVSLGRFGSLLMEDADYQLGELITTADAKTKGVDFRGMPYLFADSTFKTLVVVPENRVEETDKEAPSEATERFAEFNWTASQKALEVDLPDAAAQLIGHASWILYGSRKRIENGDLGEMNAYFHEFQENQPVYQIEDVYLIDGVRIDARGILN